MDHYLYVAMSGANQILDAQQIHMNNLANLGTTGFRAKMEHANSLSLGGDGYPSVVHVLNEGSYTDFTPGGIQTTGRDMDVAIQGDGFLAVQGPDGKEAYTRAGNLKITESGQLETANGYPVLGDGGAIAIPPAEKVEILEDGSINIRPQGQSSTSLAVVDRLKLVNPDTKSLIQGEDGLYRLDQGQTAESDSKVRVVSGSLETSNVNPVQELVQIISASRQFEMNVKMMENVKQNSEKSARIMQL